ncbi:hypothetical protein TNCV_391741 [Trichonephila clavipes]|nr:hypothetical protein TNCV_391741 [Trichonephila clavipes]
MANRNSINDLHHMKTAVWAANFHLLSSNESPQHGLCPAIIGRLKIRQGPTFCVPMFASQTDTAVRSYYGRLALFDQVTKHLKSDFRFSFSTEKHTRD